jgi:hypothetical protein
MGRRGAKIKIKKGRPAGKDPSRAPPRLRIRGSMYAKQAMGYYRLTNSGPVSSLSTPLYTHETQKLYLYKKGKRWRIGSVIGSDESLLACNDPAWWPIDIDHQKTRAFWQL